MVDVKIKVFPEVGDAFVLLLSLDGNRNIEEQVSSWIDEFLSGVACQEYKVLEVDGLSVEENLQPKPSAVASRLEKINAYKDNEVLLKAAKERQLEGEAESLVQQIRALKPRIDELLAVGNACLGNGIELDYYGACFDRSADSYERGTFITNSISHRVGFVRDWGLYDRGHHQFTMLGINNGGACGHYDFRTDGERVYFVNEDDRTDVKNSSFKIGDLKGFLQKFDVFESAFYAYVDKVIEKQQKSVDSILADAQGRVQDGPSRAMSREIEKE